MEDNEEKWEEIRAELEAEKIKNEMLEEEQLKRKAAEQELNEKPTPKEKEMPKNINFLGVIGIIFESLSPFLIGWFSIIGLTISLVSFGFTTSEKATSIIGTILGVIVSISWIVMVSRI